MVRRQRVPELMDQREADPDQLSRSLVDLREVNRWLGGKRSAVRLVLSLAGRVGSGPVSVLDVGTGGADLPLSLTGAARARGQALQVTGLDLHPTTVAYARKATAGDPDIQVVPGNALDLPFNDEAFDIAMCHTTLHHFDPPEAVQAMREMDRVARWGLVLTDLARSGPAMIGARLLAATVWRGHPITRHDGPASVRAAFTTRELRSMASEALSSPFRVQSEPIFRMSLVLDRTPSGRADHGPHAR